MLTLVGVNPSWIVGWESSRVYKQLQRINGVETVVNGHLLVTTRVGHFVTVPGHAAWVCSERVGGAVDWRRESTRKRRRSTVRGGEEPRGVLPDLQSSPAYQPQTLLQSTKSDLNSPAIYKAQLINAAIQVQAPAKTSAACCFADALALPWAHHRSTPASGEALQ